MVAEDITEPVAEVSQETVVEDTHESISKEAIPFPYSAFKNAEYEVTTTK